MTRLTLVFLVALAGPAAAQNPEGDGDANGTVAVAAGTVAVASAARLSTPYGVAVAAGATLDTGTGTLALTGSADQTLSAATLGTLALAKTGGAVVLGADLAVTGVLTAGGGTLAPGAFTLRLAPTVAGGQVVRLAALAGDGAALGGPVTFERPHRDGAGWRMIAAPFAAPFTSLNDDFHTQGAAGATFPFGGAHLFAWDPARPPAERYVAVADFAAPFVPGRGYFFNAYGTAPGTGAPLLPTVWDVAGTEAPDGVTGASAYGPAGDTFHLLGNPFAAPIDWHEVRAEARFVAAYATWDPAAAAYAYYSVAGVATGRAGRYIPALQAFWAEPTSRGPATFRHAWKRTAASPVVVGREPDVAQLRFHLEGEGLVATEPVALLLDGGDDDYDATWLAPLTADYAAAAFVRAADGRALIFEARPAPPLAQPLRLAVDATRAGTYTLSWPALDLAPPGPLVLTDLVTGTQVDLRATPSYVFTLGRAALPRPATEVPAAEHRTVAARFEVTSRASTATPAEPAVAEPTLAGVYPNPTRGRAAVRFALPDARPVRVSLVDLLGRTVATVVDGALAAGWHEVTVDTAALAAGVYVLRLDAGGTVRVARLAVAR